jgi:hypothetical protein
MATDVLIIVALALGPALLHIFAIKIFWRRVTTALHHAGHVSPFNTVVCVAHVGPEAQAVTRLLDRSTRLDLEEIDALVETGQGRLPLPMSRSAAQQLVQELQRLGAVAAVEPRGGNK